MLLGDALAGMGVVKAELVAAVVAHGHRDRSEMHDLDLMGVAAVRPVRVVAPVHGGQRRPDDRIGTVRRHIGSIGTAAAGP